MFSYGKGNMVYSAMLGVLQPARVMAALKILLRTVHACEVVAALEQTVNW